MRRALPLLALALAAAACKSSQETPPPPPGDVRAADDYRESKQLGPYLEMFPLGDRGRRKDLLATTDQRSTHLVQCDLSIPWHYHPERLEIAYVLTGEGTVFIEDRSYPAAPGATFRIEPGKQHSVQPSGDEPLVALVWFEPPLREGEDDAVPVER